MPAAPPAKPSPTRPPFECRVRFHAHLANAVVVSPEAPLPPLARPKAAAPAAPAPVAPPPAPVNPADFWKTDIARELKADRDRIEAALGQVRDAVGALRADHAGRLQELQRAAAELAASMATRLLHDTVIADEFPVERKVRDMLAQLDDSAPATIHLNPDDVRLLESRLAGAPLAPGRDDVRVESDASLGRGDCRVEAGDAMLVSSLVQELQELRDELLRSFGHARS
jgi:hypothetical protein